jgi:hypothetical protein
MGWTLTDVVFKYQEEETMARADGNNVAWVCPNCHQPLLFIYMYGRIGSSRDRPTPCGCKLWLYLSPEFNPANEPTGTKQPGEVMEFKRATEQQPQIHRATRRPRPRLT